MREIAAPFSARVTATRCGIRLCAAPQPPREPVVVTYGREDGLLKSSGDPSLLLDPPIRLTDDLFHLRDKSRPETMAHIEAEIEYAAAAERRSDGWRRHQEAMLQRLTAPSPPAPEMWRGGGDDTNGWQYARRSDASRGAYPIYLRRRVGSDAVQELLDSNMAPAWLTSEYMPDSRFLGSVRGVSVLVPSPSGRLAAYTVDESGGESYTLMLLRNDVDAERGGEATDDAAAELAPAAQRLLRGVSVDGVDAEVVWGGEGAAGAETLFYATMDDTGRPFRLHRLLATSEGDSGSGSAGPAAAATAAPAVFEERDRRFRLGFWRAADGSRLMVELHSRDASELWALRFEGRDFDPDAREEWKSGFAAGGAWECLGRRAAGNRYRAAYRGPRSGASDGAPSEGGGGNGGAYYIVSRDADSPEGVLRCLAAEAAAAGGGRGAWRAVGGVVEAAAARSLQSVQCWRDFVVVEGRHEGTAALFVLHDDGDNDGPAAVAAEAAETAEAAEAAEAGKCVLRVVDGGVLLCHGQSAATTAAETATGVLEEGIGQWSLALCPPSEQAHEARMLRVEVSSPTSPPAVVAYDVASGAASTLWAQPPPDGFDPSRYVAGRLWAPGDDGVRVPVSVLYRRDAADADQGAAAAPTTTPSDAGSPLPLPTLLYGYGAYGESSDPGWDAERIAFVDAGALHAIGHVRGGGELGAAWHAAGSRAAKPTSFADLEACARTLRDAGLAREGAIALEGRSAGGLLVGATANRAPALFSALLASVPFLDAAGTLQDGSLPLTANEWEEFGNPNEEAHHATLLGFSPVHSVPRGVAYPRALLLPQLNDARTGFWEALKFADAIRRNGERGNEVLVRMGRSGHFRSADPQQRAEERAYELGFVLDTLLPAKGNSPHDAS